MPTDWTPPPFTEAELEGIDPVIRAYMSGVDQTLVIASLRMTPQERVVSLQQMMNDLQAIRPVGREDDDARHAV